jgi:ATP-dependent DNA ligase
LLEADFWTVSVGDVITASALALSWLFYLLAKRQADTQQKLIENLLSTVAESRAAVRDLALLAMDRERLSVNGLLYRELLEEQSRRRATASPLLTVSDCQRIARDLVGIGDDAQVTEHLALLQGPNRLYCDDLGSPEFPVTVVT